VTNICDFFGIFFLVFFFLFWRVALETGIIQASRNGALVREMTEELGAVTKTKNWIVRNFDDEKSNKKKSFV